MGCGWGGVGWGVTQFSISYSELLKFNIFKLVKPSIFQIPSHELIEG